MTTILALLSLALCVASAFLWVRSYRGVHVWFDDSGGGNVPPVEEASSENGHVWYMRYMPPPVVPPGSGSSVTPQWVRLWQALKYIPWSANWITLPHQDRVWNLPGISIEIKWVGVGTAPNIRWFVFSRWIDVQYWAPVVITAILPAIWVVTIIRRRRQILPGRCAQCGYDLRVTPDRCPECGAMPIPSPNRI